MPLKSPRRPSKRGRHLQPVRTAFAVFPRKGINGAIAEFAKDWPEIARKAYTGPLGSANGRSRPVSDEVWNAMNWIMVVGVVLIVACAAQFAASNSSAKGRRQACGI